MASSPAPELLVVPCFREVIPSLLVSLLKMTAPDPWGSGRIGSLGPPLSAPGVGEWGNCACLQAYLEQVRYCPLVLPDFGRCSVPAWSVGGAPRLEREEERASPSHPPWREGETASTWTSASREILAHTPTQPRCRCQATPSQHGAGTMGFTIS